MKEVLTNNEILQCYLKTYQLTEDDYIIEDGHPVFHSDFRKDGYCQFGMGWVCGRNALMKLEGNLVCQE